ncbi:DNA glycosylase [Chytridium lagenaria]|nr:DNA glycosylase [Chytridium lagenaria]
MTDSLNVVKRCMEASKKGLAASGDDGYTSTLKNIMTLATWSSSLEVCVDGFGRTWKACTETESQYEVEEEGQRAYEVWVSEIMLQQTQVATVIEYYKKWMLKWPTVFDLAKAELEDVNQVWSGLGYYSRAKRMLEAAKVIVKEYNGILPKDTKELEKRIPGIGPYTAGAVASIAYDVAAPVVDGNVIRVVARVLGFGADSKSKSGMEAFWKYSAHILDKTRPGDFNQALMDIGATLKAAKKVATESVLFPKKAQEFVVLQSGCTACRIPADMEDFAVTRYPLKVKRKAQKLEDCAVSIIEYASKLPKFLVMITKTKGLLANLWDFPNLIVRERASTDEGDDDETTDALSTSSRRKAMDSFLTSTLGIHMTSPSQNTKENISQPTTTLHRTLYIEHVVLGGEVPRLFGEKRKKEEVQARWMSEEEMDGGAVPITLRKALAVFEGRGERGVKAKVIDEDDEEEEEEEEMEEEEEELMMRKMMRR